MENIHGYELTTELKNDNSGYAKWGFARRDGIDFFIKEFLSPVYPVDEGVLSAAQITKKREICRLFEEEKRRLYKELNKCSTGNIVIVTDFFRHKNKYYIVTDKVDAAPIEPGDIAVMPNDQKFLIIKIILYCVMALHNHNIVHGDLKPDNILLKKTRKGLYAAKLIDFDSSFLLSEPPAADDIQGDMVYMAPETFMLIAEEEGMLTTKIDVFALGVLFHQYFSSDLPEYDRSEYNYTFEAVLDGCELGISSRVPDDFKPILKKMLKRNPDERPSIQQIFEELAGTLEKPKTKPKIKDNNGFTRLKNTMRHTRFEEMPSELNKKRETEASHAEKKKDFFMKAGEL